jgi:type I restriction enzyme R subunit
MSFNENTRVKIPAILHLCRLGYEYLPISKVRWDEETNIACEIFLDSMRRINPEIEDDDIGRLFEDIKLELDNEDLGEAFFKRLLSSGSPKIVDFENFDNNSFHVVTELPCQNGEEEFRPDITVLINGMPLAFIEVKKPNNQEGVLAERDRINTRFGNKKFRKFINITQLLVFSNNMEYDLESVEPIQGAFYSSTSTTAANFNCFREERKDELGGILTDEKEESENFVLIDNNLLPIKHSPEFLTNKGSDKPTNRIITSLFSRDRLKMLLRYCIAYVHEQKGIEKHVMRYPQFFATKAIEDQLNKGATKGVIWHTQGSGKTALAYYNVNYLTDYYRNKGIIPKFYFIVDRIDLLTQAKQEFTSRGLAVRTVNSRDELLADFKSNQAIHNLSGQREITVVNIQKFKDDSDILQPSDYDLNVKRIYFLDEVHRSYNPKGSFLANLVNSDRNAIHIGLTGTPLIGKSVHTTQLFGDYFHKYYYNRSIEDGYTLKLIREGIETEYRLKLQQALEQVQVLKKSVDPGILFSHERFVEPMLDYVIRDFVNSRIRMNDDSIGAMVVCHSAEQARNLFKIFVSKYNPDNKVISNVEPFTANSQMPEESARYLEKKNLSASLVLWDVGAKEDRKDEIDDFKAGNIDILFVYNMLLTGFDAKRLKKLYLSRNIKDHNLLQTLTRVNRPYKKFRYGYVVDFADIRDSFEATNQAYLNELQDELGNEFETYTGLFLSPDEIEIEIAEIQDKLFSFDLKNAENFSTQISQIEDRKEVLEIKKALQRVRDLYNIIRTTGHVELLEKIDFRKLSELYIVAHDRLAILNLKDALKNNVDNTELLNIALEEVIFSFRKVSEEEMRIADELKDILKKTREGLSANFDKKDAEYISLYEELRRLFADRNLDEVTQDEMKSNIASLQQIYDKVADLNRRNNRLRDKYRNDVKYVRVHKRLIERGTVIKRESQIYDRLTGIKTIIDNRLVNQHQLLKNDGFFKAFVDGEVVIKFEDVDPRLDVVTSDYITACLVDEYLDEYQGKI